MTDEPRLSTGRRWAQGAVHSCGRHVRNDRLPEPDRPRDATGVSTAVPCDQQLRETEAACHPARWWSPRWNRQRTRSQAETEAACHPARWWSPRWEQTTHRLPSRDRSRLSPRQVVVTPVEQTTHRLPSSAAEAACHPARWWTSWRHRRRSTQASCESSSRESSSREPTSRESSSREPTSP